ncbi:MAG: hypothetical protein Q4P17_07640 [Methanobacterium sp.]|nr:hypothetical protein [Methanobacterium sp.]
MTRVKCINCDGIWIMDKDSIINWSYAYKNLPFFICDECLEKRKKDMGYEINCCNKDCDEVLHYDDDFKKIIIETKNHKVSYYFCKKCYNEYYDSQLISMIEES